MAKVTSKQYFDRAAESLNLAEEQVQNLPPEQTPDARIQIASKWIQLGELIADQERDKRRYRNMRR